MQTHINSLRSLINYNTTSDTSLQAVLYELKNALNNDNSIAMKAFQLSVLLYKEILEQALPKSFRDLVAVYKILIMIVNKNPHIIKKNQQIANFMIEGCLQLMGRVNINGCLQLMGKVNIKANLVQFQNQDEIIDESNLSYFNDKQQSVQVSNQQQKQQYNYQIAKWSIKNIQKIKQHLESALFFPILNQIMTKSIQKNNWKYQYFIPILAISFLSSEKQISFYIELSIQYLKNTNMNVVYATLILMKEIIEKNHNIAQFRYPAQITQVLSVLFKAKCRQVALFAADIFVYVLYSQFQWWKLSQSTMKQNLSYLLQFIKTDIVKQQVLILQLLQSFITIKYPFKGFAPQYCYYLLLQITSNRQDKIRLMCINILFQLFEREQFEEYEYYLSYTAILLKRSLLQYQSSYLQFWQKFASRFSYSITSIRQYCEDFIYILDKNSKKYSISAAISTLKSLKSLILVNSQSLRQYYPRLLKKAKFQTNGYIIPEFKTFIIEKYESREASILIPHLQGFIKMAQQYILQQQLPLIPCLFDCTKKLIEIILNLNPNQQLTLSMFQLLNSIQSQLDKQFRNIRQANDDTMSDTANQSYSDEFQDEDEDEEQGDKTKKLLVQSFEHIHQILAKLIQRMQQNNRRHCLQILNKKYQQYNLRSTMRIEIKISLLKQILKISHYDQIIHSFNLMKDYLFQKINSHDQNLFFAQCLSLLISKIPQHQIRQNEIKRCIQSLQVNLNYLQHQNRDKCDIIIFSFGKILQSHELDQRVFKKWFEHLPINLGIGKQNQQQNTLIELSKRHFNLFVQQKQYLLKLIKLHAKYLQNDSSDEDIKKRTQQQLRMISKWGLPQQLISYLEDSLNPNQKRIIQKVLLFN